MSTPNSIGRYDIGDLVTLTATVVGTNGITPVQPSYFAFTVKDANGSVSTYAAFAGGSVANPATGCFFKDITVDSAGKWFYRAVATGLFQAAEEWSVLVDASFVL